MFSLSFNKALGKTKAFCKVQRRYFELKKAQVFFFFYLLSEVSYCCMRCGSGSYEYRNTSGLYYGRVMN